MTASSNGAPTIATSTLRAPELGRIGDPGQLHERRRPDVGRQVEVVEGLELAVPAVAGGEVDVARVVGTLSHGGSSGDGRGRRRSGPSVQGAPPGRIVARPGRARGSRLILAAELLPGGLRRARVRAAGRSAVWATRVAARSVVSSARGRRGGVAEQDRVAGRGRRAMARSGWIVGQTQLTLAMSVEPDVGSRPGPRSRRPPCWRPSGRRGRGCAHRRATPENSTSTSRRSPARRPRTAGGSGASSLVVERLVVAPDHEPGPGPVRDDVGGGAALVDDPVDAAVRSAAAGATGRPSRTARSSRRGRSCPSTGPTRRATGGP